jgi:uncharacterized membrane protein (DUF485 family)
MRDNPSLSALEAVSAARWRIALTLTIVMMAAYFGFILLVAFNKPLLATTVVPGLSLGILLGALVIIVAWVLTWIYISWANGRYDASLDRLRASTIRPTQGRPEQGRGAGAVEGRR